MHRMIRVLGGNLLRPRPVDAKSVLVRQRTLEAPRCGVKSRKGTRSAPSPLTEPALLDRRPRRCPTQDRPGDGYSIVRGSLLGIVLSGWASRAPPLAPGDFWFGPFRSKNQPPGLCRVRKGSDYRREAIVWPEQRCAA